jgi:hypothetical protein
VRYGRGRRCSRASRRSWWRAARRRASARWAASRSRMRTGGKNMTGLQWSVDQWGYKRETAVRGANSSAGMFRGRGWLVRVAARDRRGRAGCGRLRMALRPGAGNPFGAVASRAATAQAAGSGNAIRRPGAVSAPTSRRRRPDARWCTRPRRYADRALASGGSFPSNEGCLNVVPRGRGHPPMNIGHH